MEVDALTMAGRRAQTGCYSFGEFGHLARDCPRGPHPWPGDRPKGQGKAPPGKGKSKSKTGVGKGKGKFGGKGKRMMKGGMSVH